MIKKLLIILSIFLLVGISCKCNAQSFQTNMLNAKFIEGNGDHQEYEYTLNTLFEADGKLGVIRIYCEIPAVTEFIIVTDHDIINGDDGLPSQILVAGYDHEQDECVLIITKTEMIIIYEEKGIILTFYNN